jgi:hypothetical protein
MTLGLARRVSLTGFLAVGFALASGASVSVGVSAKAAVAECPGAAGLGTLVPPPASLAGSSVLDAVYPPACG